MLPSYFNLYCSPPVVLNTSDGASPLSLFILKKRLKGFNCFAKSFSQSSPDLLLQGSQIKPVTFFLPPIEFEITCSFESFSAVINTSHNAHFFNINYSIYDVNSKRITPVVTGGNGAQRSWRPVDHLVRTSPRCLAPKAYQKTVPLRRRNAALPL